MLGKINNNWISEHKKIIFTLFIIIISPILLSVANILFDFIFKLGKITGTNLRNIAEIICKML